MLNRIEEPYPTSRRLPTIGSSMLSQIKVRPRKRQGLSLHASISGEKNPSRTGQQRQNSARA